jgi:hypothetical protein
MRKAEHATLARLIDNDMNYFPGWGKAALLLPKDAKKFLDELFEGYWTGRDPIRRVLRLAACSYRAGMKHQKAIERGIEPSGNKGSLSSPSGVCRKKRR